jgi:hypothetical protein
MPGGSLLDIPLDIPLDKPPGIASFKPSKQREQPPPKKNKKIKVPSFHIKLIEKMHMGERQKVTFIFAFSHMIFRVFEDLKCLFLVMHIQDTSTYLHNTYNQSIHYLWCARKQDNQLCIGD